MSLITSEQDDPAVLRAEDEAILAAENPEPEKPAEDIAALIERLTNDDETPVHQG